MEPCLIAFSFRNLPVQTGAELPAKLSIEAVFFQVQIKSAAQADMNLERSHHVEQWRSATVQSMEVRFTLQCLVDNTRVLNCLQEYFLRRIFGHGEDQREQ